jgi:hypothetical protein
MAALESLSVLKYAGKTPISGSKAILIKNENISV